MTTVIRGHKDLTTTEQTFDSPKTARAAHYAMGALRIVIGWTFLWAFVDKLFALGYSTGKDAVSGNVDRFGDAAWIHGGSPTEGFLKFAADGPFQSFYNNIGGTWYADWGFMFGLAAIGISLTFGIFSRLGTIAGVTMYLLMWSVVLPPENNPLTDEHIIGAAAVLVLGLWGAAHFIGFGNKWEKLSFVQKYPIFK